MKGGREKRGPRLRCPRLVSSSLPYPTCCCVCLSLHHLFPPPRPALSPCSSRSLVSPSSPCTHPAFPFASVSPPPPVLAPSPCARPPLRTLFSYALRVSHLFRPSPSPRLALLSSPAWSVLPGSSPPTLALLSSSTRPPLTSSTPCLPCPPPPDLLPSSISQFGGLGGAGWCGGPANEDGDGGWARTRDGRLRWR
ncbi:hypothetical protein CPC08DRAFT_368701 [Agrocybe pediades]|nr:hypothetical protein CPC08DRAFT_368701 [Agrocybe pediades]